MLSKLKTAIIGKRWNMLGFAELTVWGIFVRKLLEGDEDRHERICC